MCLDLIDDKGVTVSVSVHLGHLALSKLSSIEEEMSTVAVRRFF